MKDRLRALLTGRCTWIDTATGEVEHDVLGWRSRWNLFGIHSSSWGWVRRYGTRDCGCTFNPLTRRKVLTDMDCKTHGMPLWKKHSPWGDDWIEDWYTDDEWKSEWL